MDTKKPLNETVKTTHHLWDGLDGSNSPPGRDMARVRAVVSDRAMKRLSKKLLAISS
jgi:hypothetical protein